eukprot:3826285-Prymnesium_polylepis.1
MEISALASSIAAVERLSPPSPALAASLSAESERARSERTVEQREEDWEEDRSRKLTARIRLDAPVPRKISLFSPIEEPCRSRRPSNSSDCERKRDLALVDDVVTSSVSSNK